MSRDHQHDNYYLAPGAFSWRMLTHLNEVVYDAREKVHGGLDGWCLSGFRLLGDRFYSRGGVR